MKSDFLFSLALCLLVPHWVAAHVSSISAGTGSAGRAVSEPLENPFLNPAALPYQKGYFFGTGFSQTRTPEFGNLDTFTLALTDNLSDTVVPTSLAYSESKSRELGREGLRRDVRIGLGNFVRGRNAIGFALNYRNSRAPTFSQQQVNLSMGGFFPVRREVGLAFLVENMVPSESELPEGERLSPSVSLGGSYNYKKFVRFRADLISQPGNSFGRPILALGMENYWNRWVIFRLGGQRDPALDMNMRSLGLGFAGPRFELHYAYQELRGPLDLDLRHSIDLGLPIW